MPEPRFRTSRCSHGFAVASGLCAHPDCKPAIPSGKKGLSAAKLRTPRCSSCKNHRADAVRRGPIFVNGTQHRWCDECFAQREERLKVAEERRAQPLWPHRERTG